MTITAKDVFKRLEWINSDKLKMQLTLKLQDPKFVYENTTRATNGFVITINVLGRVNESHAQDLIYQFTNREHETGWVNMTIVNSEDVPGKIPGMIEIKLYTNYEFSRTMVRIY